MTWKYIKLALSQDLGPLQDERHGILKRSFQTRPGRPMGEASFDWASPWATSLPNNFTSYVESFLRLQQSVSDRVHHRPYPISVGQ